MSGRIIAAPRIYHGLGNRVRVVLGARSLAEFTGRSFSYVWPLGARFGARMDELWDFPERRVPEAYSRLLTLRYPYRREDLAWMAADAGRRVWQIRTAHALQLPEGARSWGEQLRRLRPAADLAERIEDFHHRHLAGEPYIGVMVRTHPISNAQTLEHSPIEWFLDRMHELSQARPGVRFFVSADTADGQDRILRAFPSAVALSDKGGYNTKAALRSSIVDLYLLAGSGHILGPHYSSFPEIAQHLAPGLRLETSMTDPGTRLADEDPLAQVEDPLVPGRRR